MFSKMTRAEWLKYGNQRPNALKLAIKSGDPVADINGKDLEIRNSTKNMQAIEDFVNGTDPGFELQLKDGKSVVSNQIGKSPLFGGKGQGAGATGITAKGESLQCLYLAAMLGEPSGKKFSHFTPETLKSYYKNIETDKSFKEMMSADIEWHYSAYITAEYLIKKKFVNRNHVFHRGSKVMNDIYKSKRMAFKKDGKPPLNDDKWNPGDIWAVKKGLNVNQLLDTTSVGALNTSLKDAYQKRQIIGISLKQINSLKKRAKHSEYNLETAEMGVHKYTRSILKSDRRGASYWTFKGGYIYFDATRRMDVRAPSAMGALNVEIQGKGARGGRAGYAAIMYASQMFLKKKLSSNADLKSRAQKMMRGKDQRSAKELWKKVSSIHKDVSWDDFWIEMQTATVDRIHANLAATEVIYNVNTSSKKQQSDFVSYLVNMAGSKTEDSSVYLKIEAA